MDVTTGLWIWTVTGLLAIIAVDIWLAWRDPHEVGFREAAAWSTFYVGIALAFGGWLFLRFGGEIGTEYLAAYLVEKSLSVDNLFVFAIILAQFAVPRILQQRVLLIGVVLALVLRAIFIAVGAAALKAFTVTFVLFGAILLWTGIGLLRHWREEPDAKDNSAVRLARRWFPVTDDYHGDALTVRISGKRHLTPLLLVMVAVASTDLLFALDSIPATFGVTTEPYLVFTANAFALLGLRALYFLLDGLLDRLIYLSLSLAAILIFIGVKLMLVYAHEVVPSIPKIPTGLSLGVIAVILVAGVVASLRQEKRNG